MGKHYNSRLFGDAAGKAILGWAARTRKKTIAAKKRQSHTRRIMTGLRGEVSAHTQHKHLIGQQPSTVYRPCSPVCLLPSYLTALSRVPPAFL